MTNITDRPKTVWIVSYTSCADNGCNYTAQDVYETKNLAAEAVKRIMLPGPFTITEKEVYGE